MHCEHCIAIALIVITSLPFLVIQCISISHKTLSEAQTTSQIDIITYCLSLLLCSTHCIVSGPHAYYLSVLPKSRAHSIFSLLTHCLSRLHTHWYHPSVLLISLLTHCLRSTHTLVSSQCLPRHSYRTHSYRPKPADLKNSIQTWETTT